MKYLTPFALIALAAPALAAPAAPAKTAAPAAPLALVTFRPSADVRQAVVRLADVAVVEGEDHALVERLESVEVGAAPLVGRSRTVSAQYARIRIRSVGVNPDQLQFGGPEFTTVTRPDQTVPGAMIEKTACNAVEAANPGSSAEAAYSLPDLHLPEGKLELKAAPPRISGGSSGTINIQLLVDGRVENTVTVSFRLVRKAPVVVAARDLPIGTVLTEADVKIEERPVLPGPLVISEPRAAIGQEVRTPVKGGTSLTEAMLREPVLIKRGARVKLVCRSPSFTVSTMGEALQDAVAGAPVRVRNLNSLLEVTGRAASREIVEIAF